MDFKQMHTLLIRGIDVQGAVRRCCGNEQLYIDCLKAFMEDTTISELNSAVSREAWDDAFTAAHALKGLAGNLGFVPLMHSTSQLVILIRGGRISDIGFAVNDVNSCYRDITDAIHQLTEIDCKNG